ncbi:MAG: hypothetical protein Fur003_2230 [Candidatus Dojkabacteria bacterium]
MKPTPNDKVTNVMIFIGGLLLGFLLLFCVLKFNEFLFEFSISVNEIISVLVTLFIAFYIPFKIESTINNSRLVKSFVSEQAGQIIAQTEELTELIDSNMINRTPLNEISKREIMNRIKRISQLLYRLKTIDGTTKSNQVESIEKLESLCWEMRAILSEDLLKTTFENYDDDTFVNLHR